MVQNLIERFAYTMVGLLGGLAAYAVAAVAWYINFWCQNNPGGLLRL